MASDPAAGVNVPSFGRGWGDHDGSATFAEAVTAVQDSKLSDVLQTPIIVRRPAGDLRISDLPLRDMNEHGSTDKNTVWEQWGGIVQRGERRTLVLTRLDPEVTVKRSPGPGPMRKRDWTLTAHKYLKDRRVILHTDGAKAYKLKLPGVLHDNCVPYEKEGAA